jgi:protein-arginine kinase activator protein McsA
MLCERCKKNQATKTYERTLNGGVERRYYCLQCHHSLFASPELPDDSCPYCGTTKDEVRKRNMVGCAKCYQTHADVLNLTIRKMQGVGQHKGKAPQGGEAERLSRRCYELKTTVDKLNKSRQFERAKAYTEILSRLQSGDGAEEEYVWRKCPRSLKQS